MSVTEELARFVVNTHYNDLDKKVIGVAKQFMLDGLGAMVVGVREPVSQIAIKHVKAMGGVAEVGVPGAGFRTSLTNAAFVGGISVHAIEHEAVGRLAGSSPMGIIPTALSVAEKFRASGPSVLEACILGYEVQGRLGLGCPGGSNRGWSGVYFPIGVAICASKIMNLSVDQTRAAIGIATDAIGGTFRHCGYMHHFVGMGGTSAQNGVTAALLAKAGVTADLDMIDGEGGFGEWVGEFQPEKVTKGLGSPFYIVSPGAAIKKYNCCFGMHRGLDALWQLIWEHDIHYDQVEHVEVEVPKFSTRLIHYSDPQTGSEAKFSWEHAFAVLLIDRLPNQTTEARAFSDFGASDPKYKEARKKVKVIVTEQPGGRTVVGKEVPVTIRMKDGRVYSKEASMLKGSPEMPLNEEEILAKYEEHVSDFLSPQQIQRSVDLVFNLDGLADILEVMEVTTFGHVRSKS